MSKNQLTRAEGKNIVVVNYGDAAPGGHQTSDGDGWMQTFMGGSGSSMQRHSAQLQRTFEDREMHVPASLSRQPTTRAAHEANELFPVVVKYAGLGAGLWFGLPMVGSMIQGLGLAVALGAGFLFLSKKKVA